jgi:hypothetical protein
MVAGAGILESGGEPGDDGFGGVAGDEEAADVGGGSRTARGAELAEFGVVGLDDGGETR